MEADLVPESYTNSMLKRRVSASASATYPVYCTANPPVEHSIPYRGTDEDSGNSGRKFGPCGLAKEQSRHGGQFPSLVVVDGMARRRCSQIWLDPFVLITSGLHDFDQIFETIRIPLVSCCPIGPTNASTAPLMQHACLAFQENLRFPKDLF